MTNSSLVHHGILGQKWGVRRYQNEDGSLTKAGKTRYEKSDDRTYNYTNFGKEYSKNSIQYPTTDTKDKINSIYKSLSPKEKQYLGGNPISEHTVYANTKNGAYIVLDDYGDKYKDEHPYRGKIVSIAASKESRGTGVTDALIKEAIKENPNAKLIAEIDSNNVHSKHLFERNGFDLIDEFDDISFYKYDKKIKHGENAMNRNDYLAHHGILGQKWGIRRYQNADGSLTSAGKKHVERMQERSEKKDIKWAERNRERITNKTYNKSEREMKKFVENDLNKKFADQVKAGRIGKTYMNQYNRKLAELMNKNVGDITSPSGRSVRFVAKRGNLGVYMALADQGYDMKNVKNGVYDGGRIAYKKSSVGFRG